MKKLLAFLIILISFKSYGQDETKRFIIQSKDASICDGGKLNLSVDVSWEMNNLKDVIDKIDDKYLDQIHYSVNWYDGENNITPLGRGSSFNTPEISSSKTYYVSVNYSGGLPVISDDFKKVDGEGLIFDLFTPTLLNSVDVYSNMAGKISVAIKKTDGTQIVNKSFSVTTGLNKLPLNCSLPSGWGFIIEAFGLSPDIKLTTNKPDKWPISLGTFGEIVKGTENKKKYNYFFNWDVSTARVPVNATVIKSTQNIITKSECDKYFWTETSETYDKSGTYANVKGCHTEKLKLIITPSSKKTEVKSACVSFVWSADGKKYQTSGTYTTTSNCLTQELVLTIEPHKTNVTKQSATDSYTWSVNNKIYKVSGTYTEEIGCATEKLDLTITLSAKAIAEKKNNPEVRIGEQIWMAKNLNVSTFRKGDPIPEVKSEDDWENAAKNHQPAWCYYDNEPKNGAVYGKLYNWYAVSDPRGLAPNGWHIPSDEEWTDLHLALGGGGGNEKYIYFNSSPIKSASNLITEISYREHGGGYEYHTTYCSNCNYWTEDQKKYNYCSVCRNKRSWTKKGKAIPKTKEKIETIVEYGYNGDNSTGFSALPAGQREIGGNDFNGGLDHLMNGEIKGRYATWWTATEYDSHDRWSGTRAYVRHLDGIPEFIYRWDKGKGNGYSVRCIKNNNSENEFSTNSESEWNSKNKFKTEITDCEWKPSDGMYFKCNGGCEEIESGDIFRAYVNKHFPEIAKKYGLSLKGSIALSYCNKTMKDVWNHVYNSDDFPGLKGNTIGKIYIDGMQPPNFIMDCEPWLENNYFINDYKTDEERDQAAFEMIVSFNDEFDMIFDRLYLKQCDITIDNDLGWAERNNKKDLHKNPVVKIISNKSPYNEKWYDYWRKSQK
jgi:uncharacterized protein (TIGR02145 family)